MGGHRHVRSLILVLSLAVLLSAAYAGAPGDVSTVQDSSSALKTPVVGSWERAQDTPSGDVMTITPAPPGYDSGEMPNYLPPEEPQPLPVREKEVVIGSILNWQMDYSEPASVPGAQEAGAQENGAPATGLLLGGSTTLWGAGIAALLIAIVALYWTGKNSQAPIDESELNTPVEYPPLTSARRRKSGMRASKKLPAKKKRRR